jgi:YHS domain-containing protein
MILIKQIKCEAMKFHFSNMKKNLLPVLVSFAFSSCLQHPEESPLRHQINHPMPEEGDSSFSNQNLNAAGLISNIDPVCGMTVDTYLADTAAYKDAIYGFCSQGCKEMFLENPDYYFEKISKP